MIYQEKIDPGRLNRGPLIDDILAVVYGDDPNPYLWERQALDDRTILQGMRSRKLLRYRTVAVALGVDPMCRYSEHAVVALDIKNVIEQHLQFYRDQLDLFNR